MKTQIVVRTFPNGGMNPFGELERKLHDGYTIVMCNPIGECLEYILEREWGN